MRDCLIVIASFADGFLDELLTSIEENTKDVDYVIQVVDNHRNRKLIEETVVKVCKEHNVPYHLDINITGYGDALNTGVEVSNEDTKYVLYMDSDTKVAKGWLREMINCYERNYDKGCRLVGPLVKNFNNKYLNIMSHYRADGNVSKLEGVDTHLTTCYLVGVCYLRERSTINEFKWDKNFFRAYAEDMDFAKQVLYLKYSMFVSGKALMYHSVNSSHKTMKDEGHNPSNVAGKNRNYLNEKWKHIDTYKKTVTPEVLNGSTMTRDDKEEILSVK